MAKMKKSVTGTSPVWQVYTYTVLLLVVLVAVFPAIWMLSTSVKLSTEQYDVPPQIIPNTPTISNYVNVLTNSKMYLAFINSVIITACVVAVILFISILASHGLGRYKFKGHGVLKIALLFGQMIPSVVIIIPLYFLVAETGFLDTHFSLILADLALTIPMGVIMLSSFFETVPKELEKTAKIDGCTGMGVLFRVVLPIAEPGLISVATYTYIHAWEELLFTLNLSTSTRTKTLPITIHMFVGEFFVNWGSTMAASAVVTFPVLLIFLSYNKYLIKGMADGAIKG